MDRLTKMPKRLSILLAILLATAHALFQETIATYCQGQEEKRSTAVDTAVDTQRFSINKGGDAIILPVRVGNATHPFLFDTGASETFIDESLISPLPKKSVSIDTPAGSVPAAVVKPPELYIGTRRFDVAEIAAFDLAPTRRAGAKVYGVLGMDFLKTQIVRIDFDRGELEFLTTVKKEGVTVPLRPDVGNRPRVSVRVASEAPQDFVIDTGWMSYNSGAISRLLQRDLLLHKSAHLLGYDIGVGYTGKKLITRAGFKTVLK